MASSAEEHEQSTGIHRARAACGEGVQQMQILAEIDGRCSLGRKLLLLLLCHKNKLALGLMQLLLQPAVLNLELRRICMPDSSGRSCRVTFRAGLFDAETS